MHCSDYSNLIRMKVYEQNYGSISLNLILMSVGKYIIEPEQSLISMRLNVVRTLMAFLKFLTFNI